MATKLQKVPRRIWLHRKVKNQPFVSKLKSKDNARQTLHTKLYASGVKTSELGGG